MHRWVNSFFLAHCTCDRIFLLPHVVLMEQNSSIMAKRRKISAYDFFLWMIEKTVFKNLTKLRRELLSAAGTRVLEIGVGTGLNLECYPSHVQLVGVEPEPIMTEISQAGFAEQLPFKNETFDTVVSTLVLCSVQEPARAVSEARRVLKVGGKLLLMEHVRQAGFKGKMQDFITPLWMKVAGGCHLNRELDELILASGLTVIEVRILWNGLGRYWVLSKMES